MDDTFNQDELTPEDLAVLQAFDALDMQNWESEIVDEPEPGQPSNQALPVVAELASAMPPLTDMLDANDMLTLFVSEVDEDIAVIRRTLQQSEPDEQLDTTRLHILQRIAHKIKGTSGAIGCHAMSTIAHYMEELAAASMHGTIAPSVGLNALAQTASALMVTLNGIVSYGKEDPTPLTELEAQYKALSVDKQMKPLSRFTFPSENVEADLSYSPPIYRSASEQEHVTGLPFVRIDIQRLKQLALHTEQLAELRAPLKNAQADMEKAFQELQTAQARLRHLEILLSTTLARRVPERAESVVQSPSSLVARILRESGQRANHFYLPSTPPRRPHNHQGSPLHVADVNVQWDELELDHISESDLLIRSFNEAVADVATASAQLRLTFAQLSRVTQKHVHLTTNVRNDALLLRLAPISTLITRLQRAVSMGALVQHRHVQFEVEGETIEIDQDILEELKHPLLQLVRTCLAHSFTPPSEPSEQPAGTDRIWFYARTVGSEVTIELGFAMAVGGGAMEEVQEAIHLLHGSITVQRNTPGGISFHLRLPRLQGVVQGLLVRAGNQHVLVPFSQVQRIDVRKQSSASPVFSLNALLGFPADLSVQRSDPPPMMPEVQPLLIVQVDLDTSLVQVDEVLGEVELVVKPLAQHLQRPGISGAAIDGLGNVILVVNVPELLRYREEKLRRGRLSVPTADLSANALGDSARTVAADLEGKGGSEAPPSQRSVLVADDSVFIRQSLLQTLTHAGYYVMEARDGMEALERLVEAPPDALILDLEMPNLNGFDLLNIIRTHPQHSQLARVKIVMLSSRSLEKHKVRAHELGAHAFLVKPCPQETLLATLKSLLAS